MFAGTETSGSGEDLHSLTLYEMPFDLARELMQGEINGAKMTACTAGHHEQAMLTQQLANVATVDTSAFAKRCVSNSAAHKRRQRNRPLPQCDMRLC